MTSRKIKQSRVEDVLASNHQQTVMERLPDTCRKSARTHINSIYVGTIIRIYDTRFGAEGHFATAHWRTSDSIYVILHSEKKCNFVDLKYKKWVVDQRCVKVGAFKLFSKASFKDIDDDL